MRLIAADNGDCDWKGLIPFAAVGDRTSITLILLVLSVKVINPNMVPSGAPVISVINGAKRNRW